MLANCTLMVQAFELIVYLFNPLKFIAGFNAILWLYGSELGLRLTKPADN